MLGIIKRTFDYKNKDILVKLYKSLVRSHLEYGNVIWAPHLKRQSVIIEKVQRRATRLVPECKNMNYGERLRYLKLYSLKGRRLRGDLIQVFKIFKGIDDIQPSNILPLSLYEGTRNQTFKLRHRYAKTDIRKYSFSYRVVGDWNSLPDNVKNAKTLNAFKNALDSIPKFKEKFFGYDE